MSISALAVGLAVQRTRRGKASSQRERILWIDRTSNLAVTIALDNDKAYPEVVASQELDRLWASGEVVQVADDYAYLATLDISDHQERCDRNWNAIASIVEDEPRCYDPPQRAKLVTAAEKATGRKRDMLLRDLRRYWQAGKQKAALATHYDRSGGPGVSRNFEGRTKAGRRGILEKHGHVGRGIPVTPEIATLFERYLKKFVLRKNPLKLSAAYIHLCKDHFSTRKTSPAGRVTVVLLPLDRRPTLRQFRYYAQKAYKISERKKAQDGIEAYEQTLRPVLGNSSKDVMGPGDVGQIDSTETDTHLVNSILRERPIGCATHYFMTDAFSGAIEGIFVGVERPSLLGARLTLANTASDKVEYCARYGIEIVESEWPCRHFPNSIIADKGELIAKAADELVEEQKLKITNLPARRPDWKGFVEGNFNLANHVLHSLPGARRRSSNPNRDDPRLSAALDIYGITQVLIEFTLHYDRSHILERHPFDLFEIQENIRPRPLDLWNWGVLHRSGALRVKSEDAIRMLLLERGEAVVSGYGLRFAHGDYDCKIAHDEEWFQNARAKGRWSVPICYDRRNLQFIYLLPKNRGPLIACHILRRDYQMIGQSLEDITDYAQFKKYDLALMREEETSSGATLAARVESVVEAQQRLTRDRKKIAPPLSKTEKRTGIRKNRDDERARQNAAIHAEHLKGLGMSTFPNTVTERGNTGDASGATSLAKYREERGLKALRERRQPK